MSDITQGKGVKREGSSQGTPSLIGTPESGGRVCLFTHVRQSGLQQTQGSVSPPEVMPPLGDTVGLIYGYERES